MRALKAAPTRNVDAWNLAADAGVSFAASYLSTGFLKVFHRTPPLLPADAILLVIFLGAPQRRRPVYIAACLAAYIVAGYAGGGGGLSAQWATPLILGAANVIGVLLACRLIWKFMGSDPLDLARWRDLTVFGLAAGVVSPVVTALTGWALIRAWGSDLGPLKILSWAGGDCLGMLTIAPGLLMLRKATPERRREIVSRPGLIALGGLGLLAIFLFSQDHIRLGYMLPSALALVAIYMEFVGVALGGLLIAVVLVAATYIRPMDFYHVSYLGFEGPILATQLFLIFTMAMNLPFAALLAQRRRLQESLVRTRQEAEAARSQAVDRQRRLVMAEEIAKVGFWRADFRTGEAEWSDQTYVNLGWSREAALTSSAMEACVHPQDLAAYAQASSAMRRGHTQTAGWRARGGDGQVRHMVLRSIPEFDAAGQVCGAFGTVSDVTELTLAQEALAHSAAQLRLVTETVADVIVQTDLEDRITYASPSLAAVLGFRPEEAVGGSWRDLLHPEDVQVWTQAVRQLLSGPAQGADPSIHCRARAKDGREVWLGLRPALVLDDKGRPVGVVDVARDVTERNRLISELHGARHAAEAAAAVKAEFLANMSHEIRTPLTSISGFTRLAQGQGDLNADTRRYIGHISSAAGALLAIVNDVLDFSKLEAGEIRLAPRPTEVAAMMADMADLFSGQAAEKGLVWSTSYPAEAPLRLMVDPDRLRQVLINLAGNATKFTDRGEVRLRAAYDEAGQRLRMEVKDTGPGIPQDRLGVLFQRFSQVDGSNTRRFGGTGLGLAICKGLVEAMGGQIGVTSEEGQGACFWLELPAAPAEAAREPEAAEPEAAFLQDVRVLVVDDNGVNRELVRAVLTPLGAQVWEAADGAQAIEQANARAFDVILMDLRMPGMSGLQAARAIVDGQGPNAATAIVAFSADSGQETGLGPLAEHGFRGRVIKPFKPIDLITTLASAAQPQGPGQTQDQDDMQVA